MSSFRFEMYENLITKHNLKVPSWTQGATWAFTHNLGHKDVTIASIKQVDENTIEIVKRTDKNKSIFYNWGYDQKGIYERVIINRKDQSTIVDRMDINFWQQSGPFLGRRDLFYPDPNYDGKKLAFVRHDFWIHKFVKFQLIVMGTISGQLYKFAFKKTEA